MLQTATEPVRKAIYEKKVAPPGTTPRFMTMDEGVIQMRKVLLNLSVQLIKDTKTSPIILIPLKGAKTNGDIFRVYSHFTWKQALVTSLWVNISMKEKSAVFVRSSTCKLLTPG